MVLWPTHKCVPQRRHMNKTLFPWKSSAIWHSAAATICHRIFARITPANDDDSHRVDSYALLLRNDAHIKHITATDATLTRFASETMVAATSSARVPHLPHPHIARTIHHYSVVARTAICPKVGGNEASRPANANTSTFPCIY